MTQQKFELKRRIDNVIYHYIPCEPINGSPAWKRDDANLWVTKLQDFGWACIDNDNNICGIPWGVPPSKTSKHPPEDEWVSKKGDKSYVYDLVYSKADLA
jgi:hypothetical protein